MSRCEWIVCETTGRWAAALRLALKRNPAADHWATRLYETRQWNDLALRLSERPDSFVAVEVREGNLAEALASLSLAVRRYPRARFAALVDRSLSSGQDFRKATTGERQRDVCDALREAGALEIARSPRHLRNVIDLYWSHVAVSTQFGPRLSAQLPAIDQVWASLPWQAQRSGVG